jgi:hypothetical protein
MKVNKSDWTIVKEEEIDLGLTNCYNVAFNGDGRIAVVVVY